MISFLVGNKSIEKVLFFLLLNGKGYATQISQRLYVPLTPIQQALHKLEKSGVALSYYEGKTRYYTFNTEFPLINELETLLKKAYTCIPAHQKKQYYQSFFHDHPYKKKQKSHGPGTPTGKLSLLNFWTKLEKIQSMTFSAKSKAQEESGWNGVGNGTVEIKKQEENVLISYERGTWTSLSNQEMDFSNIFRWTLKNDSGVIALEHLRFGMQNPVFLFELMPVDLNLMESVDSHICNGDTYFGHVRCDKHFIQFNWRVIGRVKNEEIDYLYT